MRTIFPLDQSGTVALEVSGRGSGPYVCALNGKECHRAALSDLRSGVHLKLSNGSVVDVQRGGVLQPIYARRDGIALPPNGLAQMGRARLLAFVWGAFLIIIGGHDLFWRGEIGSLWQTLRGASQIADYGLAIVCVAAGVFCLVMGILSSQTPRLAFSVLGCVFLVNAVPNVVGWLSSAAYVLLVLALPSLISAGVFFRALSNAHSLRKLPKEAASLSAVAS